MSRDSVGHTLLVAGVLCVACSLLVSAAAVGLRPLQLKNKERERQKNILMVTGLYDETKPIEDIFRTIETQVVDLDTGEDLGAGQSGMLLIKGPNVMQGYLGKPDLTNEVIRDGWYTTGDVALVDEEEATLKKLRRRGASIALEAANPAFETRIYGPDRVRVQGKLVGLVRRYT